MNMKWTSLCLGSCIFNMNNLFVTCHSLTLEASGQMLGSHRPVYASNMALYSFPMQGMVCRPYSVQMSGLQLY